MHLFTGHKVSYCSVDHQKLDWTTHKRVCIKPDSSSNNSNSNRSSNTNTNTNNKSINQVEEVTSKDIILDPKELLIKANVIFNYQKDINNNKKIKIKTKFVTEITRICMVEMTYYLNWESKHKSASKLNKPSTLATSLLEKTYRIHLVCLFHIFITSLFFISLFLLLI
jgi:hypothetical protein